MKKINTITYRFTALCLLASVFCGCSESTRIAEHANYQSAADRYNVLDSNVDTNVADEQRALVSSTDMAALDSRSSTSPPANAGSLATPSASLDPMTQRRIADLESMVQDLRSQLDGNTGEGIGPNASSASAPRNEGDSVDASQDVDDSNLGVGSSYRHRYVRKELDRLIRVYKRARTEVAQNNVSYKLDHMMTIFKGFELLIHDTPKTFNPLPERDRYAFKKFQEVAEDLVPALEEYLNDYGSEGSNDCAEFTTLLDEAREVIEMPLPGTGNRMLDFIQELKTNLENQQSRKNE